MSGEQGTAPPAPQAVVAPPPAPFPWGPEIVGQVLAACVGDPTFALKARRCLRPEFFPDAGQSAAVEVLLDFVDRYDAVPAEAVLRAEVTRQLGATPGVEQSAQQALGVAYAQRPTNVTWLEERVGEFGQRQAMLRATALAAAHVARGEYDEALAAVSEAHAVGAHLDEGRWYIRDRTERALSRATRRPGISTGFEFIDSVVDGGSHPGELYMVTAEAKAGKTMLLLNIAAHVVQCGLRVFYLTLEVGARVLEERLDSRVLGVSREYMRASPLKASVMLDRYAGTVGSGELVTVDRPQKSVSSSDLRAMLRYLRDVRGFFPDLVVVDYADLLRPRRKRDREYQELNDMTGELRSLAIDQRVPVWTATQDNREGGVAGSFGKVAIVDAMFRLTKDPEREGLRHLSAPWVRNGTAGGSVVVEFDPDTATMRAASDVKWDSVQFPPSGARP